MGAIEGLRTRTMNGSLGSDKLETPPEAVMPLLPYIPKEWKVWEPACGKGRLATAIEATGWRVLTTDIYYADRYDFRTYYPFSDWDCIITNPPFSMKREFVDRCISLGKPWALLLPVATIGTKWMIQRMEAQPIEILLLDKRINFTGGSGAWFGVAWYTMGFDLGGRLAFGHVPEEL